MNSSYRLEKYSLFTKHIHPEKKYKFSSVAQSCLTLCDPMDRPPCPSPTPGACSNSCPSTRWCHPAISSSVTPFPSCLQSFPASGYFPMSQLFPSGGQSIGTSASSSILPKNVQSWFPLRLTGLISLQSKELSLEESLNFHCYHQPIHPHQCFLQTISGWKKPIYLNVTGFLKKYTEKIEEIEVVSGSFCIIFRNFCFG